MSFQVQDLSLPNSPPLVSRATFLRPLAQSWFVAGAIVLRFKTQIFLLSRWVVLRRRL